MKIKGKCINCICSQVDRILSKRKNIPDEVIFKIYKESFKYLSEIKEFSKSPAYYTTFIYRILRKYLKQDPFKEEKHNSIKEALKIREKLYNKYIKESKTPLENAIKLSAIGNIIDFGIKNVDLNLLNQVNKEIQQNFKIYNINYLKDKLKDSKNLVFFADNAGETVFDTFLLQEIKNKYPALKITYIVKEEPVINDAILEDAISSKVDNFVDKLITNGNDFVGTNLKACSKECLDEYNKADIIIAKGQGNFETLDEVKDKDIFFILKAKCNIISSYLKVPLGSLILLYNKCMP